jgi:hypothetical protein
VDYFPQLLISFIDGFSTINFSFKHRQLRRANAGTVEDEDLLSDQGAMFQLAAPKGGTSLKSEGSRRAFEARELSHRADRDHQ